MSVQKRVRPKTEVQRPNPQSEFSSHSVILCHFAMNLIDIQQKLKDRIRESASELFGVTRDLPNAETPPRAELGDVAFPVAFELAKLVKQATGEKIAPRTVAEKLKTKLEELPEVARVEIAGPGYINVFLDRAKLLRLFAAREPESPSPVAHKKMVEHTSINPNK